MKLSANLLALAIVASLGLAACQKQADQTMPAASSDAMASDAMATDASANAMPAMPTSAKYTVVFTPRWTKANFPLEYPDTSFIHKPHFSGWIGTAHNDNYHVFAEGTMPTPGLEHLSEMGEHDPLNSEINAAIAAGNGLALSESEPLKDFSQTVSFEVTVDNAHPSAALVAMIAPSPDWFAGVDVNLMDNGGFVASKSVDVMAWDSGGDDGSTYFADDLDTNPKKPTMPNSAAHFRPGGMAMPVGTLVFTRR